MSHRKPEPTIAELDIKQLIRTFNSATTNSAKLRSKLDRDRQFVGFAEKAKFPKRQSRIVKKFIDYFSARKLPADISLQRLGWEIVTAIDPENHRLAEELASFLLQRIEESAGLREGLEHYQYYVSFRKTSDMITHLFRECLEALAKTEADKAEVSKIK